MSLILKTAQITCQEVLTFYWDTLYIIEKAGNQIAEISVLIEFPFDLAIHLKIITSFYFSLDLKIIELSKISLHKT